MRLGLIARADNSGLGVQTHEFFLNMSPDKTMVVDISKLNGNRIYPSRYPGATVTHGFPTHEEIDRFLEGLDVVFVAESPYDYYLYSRARELGVKTAVQYNYEFFDWFARPELPKPDLLIAPSIWHYEQVGQWCVENGVQHVYLHCPVNRLTVPYREISKAKVFLHSAGRSAAYDRNGTEIVIRASRFVKSDVKILVHFQGEQGLPHQVTRSFEDYLRMQAIEGDPNKLSIVRLDHESYADIYKMGDVLLLPRRYGGNCLPLNEALSSGMPVIMPNISPNRYLLPHAWLLPAEKIGEFTPRTTIDIYDVDPRVLAETIDQFADMSEERMKRQSHLADTIAEKISWSTMQRNYHQVLEGLCTRS